MASAQPVGSARFQFSARPIDAALATRMQPSWRPGCPVGLESLRYLTIRHWGYDGKAHTGELVVNADAVGAIQSVMTKLWNARFPIERMELVDNFGANDDASMAANNTSAFNCRFVAGTTRWSEHAYGRAIDINTVQNPYVDARHVSPPNGAPYANRAARRTRHDPRRRRRGERVRDRRLGLGRQLQRGQGLPALLRVRPVDRNRSHPSGVSHTNPEGGRRCELESWYS